MTQPEPSDRNQLDWKELVDAHVTRVFRVAYRLLGSVQDAEDASQDVFLEALETFQRGFAVQNWTAFLVRLATLRSIDRVRRRHQLLELNERDHVTFTGPADVLSAEELKQWLRKAVAELPEQQASVFVMIHFEQLSQAEVALALDIPVTGVASALHKGRQRLLQRLTAHYQGELS